MFASFAVFSFAETRMLNTSYALATLQNNFKKSFESSEKEIALAINHLERAVGGDVAASEIGDLKKKVNDSFLEIKKLVIKFNSSALFFIGINVDPLNPRLHELLTGSRNELSLLSKPKSKKKRSDKEGGNKVLDVEPAPKQMRTTGPECAKRNVQGKNLAVKAATAGVTKQVESVVGQLTTPSAVTDVDTVENAQLRKQESATEHIIQSGSGGNPCVFIEAGGLAGTGNSGECSGQSVERSTGIQKVKRESIKRRSGHPRKSGEKFSREEIERILAAMSASSDEGESGDARRSQSKNKRESSDIEEGEIVDLGCQV